MKYKSIQLYSNKSIAQLKAYLHNLSKDHTANIDALTSLAGELLKANAVMYCKLENGNLYHSSSWKAQDCFKISVEAKKNLCYHILQNKKAKVFYISDLTNPEFKKEFPDIDLHNMVTYLGHPVLIEGDFKGVLCVLYTRRYEPTQTMILLLELIASLIGVEEEKKSLSRKNLESNQRYKALLDANPDMMFMISESGVFLDYKAEAPDDLLLPPDQFIGRNVYDVLPFELAKLTMDKIQMVKQTGKIQTYTYQMEIQHPRCFESRLVPCGENMCLAIIRDITEFIEAQNQLKESEKKYRQIFETANEGLWQMNSQNIITLVNQKLADRLGYQINEIIGKHPEDFMFNEDIPDSQKKLSERRTGKSDIFERRLRCKNNEEAWFVISASAIMDEKQNYAGAIAMLTDITEKKRAENQIKESEARYRRLYETTNEAIIGFDAEHNISYVNNRFHELLGYSEEEIIGKPSSLLIFPEDYEDNKRRLSDRKMGKHDIYERRLRKKDGSTIWVLISATSIIDENNNFTGSFAMLNDITDRKMMEIELQNSIARYEVQRNAFQIITRLPYISAGEVTLLAREINKISAKILEVERVSVWLFDEDNEQLKCIDLYTNSNDSHTCGMILHEEHYKNEFQALKETNYIDASDPLNDPRTSGYIDTYLKPANITSMLDVLIRSMDKNLGLICFEHVNKPHKWTQDEISFGCLLADQIALALVNQKRNQFESLLKDSEDRYRELFNIAPIGIAVHSEGKVVYCNPATAKILGYENPSEIVGKPVEQFVHPDSFDEAFSRLKTLISGEEVNYPVEYLFLKKDGSPIPVEVSATLLKHRPKPSVQILVTDISERRKTEELTKRNIERLNSIIAIHQYNPVDIVDLIKYANQEVVKIAESQYSLFFQYFADTNEIKLISLINNGIESTDNNRTKKVPVPHRGLWEDTIKKKSAIVVNNYPESRYAKNAMPPDHIPIHNILCLPVIYNGNIVALVVLANNPNGYDDVDVLQVKLLLESVWKMVENRKADEQIRRLSRAVEQSPVSIVITDVKGNIEYVNNFFTEITGYPASEVLGKNPRILKSGETSIEEYKQLWETICSGKTWIGEFHNIKANGELYWEKAYISPVFDSNGRIINFVGVKEDITLRKKMTEELIKAKEEAEQMSHVKSTFLANMSHELRTPLVGILGYSELLSNMVIDEEQREMVETINFSGKRLLNTLNMILDLSRIEANRQEIQNETFDLIEFTRNLVRLFDVNALKKGLYLNFITNQPQIIVNIDNRLLEHVINDLINNAIKYTEKGGVTVTVGIEEESSERTVQIKIKDTGIGIAKDRQQVIFEAFRQASEGYSRSFEGTGLGLTISKKYIELMGGTINLESELGKGSTFTISFPSSILNVEIENVSIPITETSETSEIKPITDSIIKPRLLLVDDDEISYHLTKKMLEGYTELDYAKTGEEALEKINSTALPYPIILLDINLPKGLNGLELLSKIRETPLYYHTPIIAVTAYSMIGDKEKFLAAGCSYYLSKPFTQEELLALTKEALQS